jgi:hypothetical protein
MASPLRRRWSLSRAKGSRIAIRPSWGRLLPGWLISSATSPPSPEAVDTACSDGKYDKPADNTCHRDDDVLIVCDPADDLVRYAGAIALTVTALAAAFAGGSVQEILLHREARVRPELRTGARQLAARRAAGVGIIVGRQTAHERLALQVAAGALTRRARKACSAGTA